MDEAEQFVILERGREEAQQERGARARQLASASQERTDEGDTSPNIMTHPPPSASLTSPSPPPSPPPLPSQHVVRRSFPVETLTPAEIEAYKTKTRAPIVQPKPLSSEHSPRWPAVRD